MHLLRPDPSESGLTISTFASILCVTDTETDHVIDSGPVTSWPIVLLIWSLARVPSPAVALASVCKRMYLIGFF